MYFALSKDVTPAAEDLIDLRRHRHLPRGGVVFDDVEMRVVTAVIADRCVEFAVGPIVRRLPPVGPHGAVVVISWFGEESRRGWNDAKLDNGWRLGHDVFRPRPLRNRGWRPQHFLAAVDYHATVCSRPCVSSLLASAFCAAAVSSSSTASGSGV